ncbi:MAG TPA: Holliday junction resolvase RuvX [Phycisphaerae bacterium]|nr:Holliday junction resolvase RuvX [Phycisphaerae bacterium]
MRILGLDLGKRRVGVALSDPGGVIAQPLAQLEPKGRRDLVAQVAHLVAEHGVQRVVVGLPLRLDGARGGEAKRAEAVVEALRDALDAPVTVWDERFSSRRADRSMRQAGLSPARQKERRDMVAATLILQAYLDAGSP